MKLYDLYLDICNFVNQHGIYKDYLTDRFFFSLCDCLHLNQVYIQRNKDGEIVAFSDYWFIFPEDLEAVSEGCRPSNVRDGSLLWIVDCCINGGSMRKMVKDLRWISGPDIRGVAWLHKGEKFVYFPHQKGGA